MEKSERNRLTQDLSILDKFKFKKKACGNKIPLQQT